MKKCGVLLDLSSIQNQSLSVNLRIYGGDQRKQTINNHLLSELLTKMVECVGYATGLRNVTDAFLRNNITTGDTLLLIGNWT